MNTVHRALDALGFELRHSARSLSKAPAFAGLAIVTLALGIGATSAVFTVLNAVLFKGLPYRAEASILHIWETDQRTQTRQVSYPDFMDVVNGARSFDGVAGYAFGRMSLATEQGVETLSAGRVSWNFFDVLGVRPALGRTFLVEEDQPLRTLDVAIISHGMWQRRFGGDPQIIGRKVTLNDTALTVIGVLPNDFQFARLGEPEVFTTLSPSQAQVERRYMHWMWAIGRLRDGISTAAVNEEMEHLGAARAAADTQWHTGTNLRTTPIREAIVGSIGPMSVALFGAVAAVLAIACANVANMLLARAVSRRRETSVRVALGASRGRVLAQSLAESLLLSLAGGALGALWAGPAVRVMVAAIPNGLREDLPYLRNLTVDPTVLAFTFGVCLIAAVAFGFAAGFRSSDRGLAETLKDGARGSGSRRRLRTALVIGEIAVAVTLVSTTALLTRSLVKLLDVDAGFETRGLAMGRVSLPSRAYDTPEKVQPFFDTLQTRLAARPGVTGVALVSRPPLMGAGNTGTPSIVGRPPAGADGPAAQLRTVNETYFDVMGLSLLEGRAFAAGDRPGSPRVIVVNRAFVDDVMNGERAVGKSATFAFAPNPMEIVGVVENERAGDLDGRMLPVIYFPWRQDSETGMSVLVRTSGDARSITNALRPEVLALEPAAEVAFIQTMDELISSSRATFMRRYPLLVLSWFAGLALVLAAIGVYGVMSLSVNERTSEMGIRVALGAQPGNLMGLVVRNGATLAVAGATLGLVLAFGAARLMTAFLFETAPYDPASLAVAAIVVSAATCLASFIPARRAARMDPIAAIRQS